MSTEEAVRDPRERLHRLDADLHAQLRRMEDVRKALVFGVRTAREAFGAAAAAVAVRRAGRRRTEVIYRAPRDAAWDGALLSAYLEGRRPRIPAGVLLAPVSRRGRKWAVLALSDPGTDFGPKERRALFSAAEILTETIAAMDARRTRSIRRRIQKKIADGREPQDHMYNILHGLLSLTRYDHSASLFVCEAGGGLRLAAEQIAWTKAKSRRIGLRIAVPEPVAALLAEGRVRLAERAPLSAGEPGPWSDPLAALMDHRSGAETDVPAELAMLCAPVTTPERALGVLKISSRRRGVLGEYETGLVQEFIPLASLAIQFSERARTLGDRVLESERKHALANLTRGIAHDVNNALGSMLPLVQQLREEAVTGSLEPEELREDLATLERSIQTCRRIFGSMLAIARGARRGLGHGNLRRAVEHALSVLEESLRRRGIEVRLELPEELPTLRGGQGDLTQLFLNLCSNARDAMGEGGCLGIRAKADGGCVLVEVEDNGCGISAAVRDRVVEPFFTTKERGNGLGLAICRSILWDVGGEMEIESREGRGTKVTLTLPVLEKLREVTT